MLPLTPAELKTLCKLTTPIKIQNHLDSIPMNWEKDRETYFSPRKAMRMKKMHCMEGALFAAAALWVQGEKPLLMDLKTKGDIDHVVALYRRNGCWGAISKTNHSTLRFRDPVYKTLRELALSYFHEYFRDKDGKKTLVSHSSKPFNLLQYGTKWITAEEDLDYIVEDIDAAPHKQLYPKKNQRLIRPADEMEKRAAKIIEWKRTDPRT